jgi:hypothetical protein
VRLSRILTDRGTKYCGNPEHNQYELYLAAEDIGDSRTTTKGRRRHRAVSKEASIRSVVQVSPDELCRCGSSCFCKCLMARLPILWKQFVDPLCVIIG